MPTQWDQFSITGIQIRIDLSMSTLFIGRATTIPRTIHGSRTVTSSKHDASQDYWKARGKPIPHTIRPGDTAPTGIRTGLVLPATPRRDYVSRRLCAPSRLANRLVRRNRRPHNKKRAHNRSGGQDEHCSTPSNSPTTNKRYKTRTSRSRAPPDILDTKSKVDKSIRHPTAVYKFKGGFFLTAFPPRWVFLRTPRGFSLPSKRRAHKERALTNARALTLRFLI